MNRQYLSIVGNAAALLGIALCAVSGLARLAGSYVLGGMELGTLFQGGIGLMLLACLAKLHLLTSQSS